jgi:pyruvate kinase
MFDGRTKIIATLGPALDAEGVLERLLDSGVDVLRVNLSHASPRDQAARVKRARAHRPDIAVLADLGGPKLRLGELAEEIKIRAGDVITLGAGGINVADPSLYDRVRVGDPVYIADGTLDLVTNEVCSDRIICRVRVGGTLRSRKGINLPMDASSLPALTDKDRADLAEIGVLAPDYIALSYVRHEKDIFDARALTKLPIIAKIEKQQALERIDAILAATDAIMVARGDLGVEIGPASVPLAQKRIIRLGREAGKVVITATQMLESMIEHPRPTRAEASDVANAIMDGTDAVMLSAETAAGAYPRLAVEAMTRIIKEIETHPPVAPFSGAEQGDGVVTTEVAIAAATVAAVGMLGAPLVVVFTKSGFSARVVASKRPPVPILALTDEGRTYRQLALVWGVVPELVPHCADYDEMMEQTKNVVVRRELASNGDRIIVTAGVPFDLPGTTNLLKVETV